MQLKLTATKRGPLGKKVAQVRAEGKLPAVVYGHHAETTSLLLDGHEFQRVFARAGRSHLVDLVIEGSAPEKVLVREIQTHPRRIGPIHVDLYQVSMQEKLHADIPIRVIGESPVVKQGDGDLLHALHQVEVECLPGDIPESFVVDVSGLGEIDAGIRVKDLKVPDGVVLLADPEELIVKVVARRELAVEAPAEEAAAEGEEGEAEEGEAEAEGSEEA
jgi:large subunit ribosomal protein L25